MRPAARTIKTMIIKTVQLPSCYIVTTYGLHTNHTHAHTQRLAHTQFWLLAGILRLASQIGAGILSVTVRRCVRRTLCVPTVCMEFVTLEFTRFICQRHLFDTHRFSYMRQLLISQGYRIEPTAFDEQAQTGP